jgi:hypothetical protein
MRGEGAKVLTYGSRGHDDNNNNKIRFDRPHNAEVGASTQQPTMRITANIPGLFEHAYPSMPIFMSDASSSQPQHRSVYAHHIRTSLAVQWLDHNALRRLLSLYIVGLSQRSQQGYYPQAKITAGLLVTLRQRSQQGCYPQSKITAGLLPSVKDHSRAVALSQRSQQGCYPQSKFTAGLLPSVKVHSREEALVAQAWQYHHGRDSHSWPLLLAGNWLNCYKDVRVTADVP